MKPSRLFSNMYAALASLLVLASAAQSSAVVTIDHSTSAATTNLTVGQTIQVQVRVSWDGQGALIGIFGSTTSSVAGVLAADSAVAPAPTGTNPFYRGSLFLDPDAGSLLGRLAPTTLRAASDPLDLIRSVQYGALGAISAGGAASNVLVTTITYRAVTNGTTTIGYFQAGGDTGAQGDTTAVGAPITVTVPEPGQVMLGLAALGSVAGVIGIRRRI